MRILLDGDACPQRKEILEMADKYHIDVLLFIDFAHEIDESLYTQVIYCDIGSDSVDGYIIKYVQSHDIVITQDYGLSSLVLTKGAKVLHVSGMIIDNHNIEELLYRRYTYSKLRSYNKHIKGNKKRTQETKKYFIEQLEKIVKENIC